MKLINSLAFKNAGLYLILFLAGLSLLGYLLLDSASSRIIKNAEDQLEHSGSQVEILFNEYIEELVTDLSFLSGNPVLKKYLESDHKSYNELLNEEFLSLLSANNDYGQIRYIDAKSGLELVRVDRMKSTPVITPQIKLQNKKNRKYFIETLNLNQDQFYFSPINLNKEHGIISEPYIPTLRIAKPIFHKSRVDGIIVINTELSKLFDKLNSSVGADFNLRILNEVGFYLLHEEKDSCFIFEFSNADPQIRIEDLIKSETIINKKSALSYNNRIVLPQRQYTIFYQLIAKKSTLLKPYFEWRKQSIMRIIFIAASFSLIAFLILSQQFKNLQNLKRSIQEYPLKRKTSELPINRSDEIGELAISFKNMANLINKQIEDIELEKHKAEKAEKDKSIFIENITHEIRNPLQSIMGLSALLEKNSPQPHQIEILNSIKFNTSNLNGLINSILDYQNILKSNISLDLQYTQVEVLIDKLITGIKYTANQKNITLITILDEEVKLHDINIDQLRITQILNNLLINAISNTPINGTIKIKIECHSKTNNHMDIKLLIEDNGIGMSDIEINKIQERYYTNSKDKLVNPNHGLGLTIVNELLHLMNSKLDIQSQKGQGSKFSFNIKTQYRNKQNTEFKFKNSETYKTIQNILIIEDDLQVTQLYKDILEDANVTYIDDLELLSQFKAEHYDLIITDFFLKNSNLKDNLTQLRHWLNEDSFLLVLSGHKKSLEFAKQSFPNAIVLEKPVPKSKILDALVKFNLFWNFGIPKLQIIKEDYDNNSEKYSKAITLLLSEWKTYKQKLGENIRSQNIEAFKETNHKLNNTLRRIGLSKLENYLSQLETELHGSSINLESKSVEIESIMESYFHYISEYKL